MCKYSKIKQWDGRCQERKAVMVEASEISEEGIIVDLRLFESTFIVNSSQFCYLLSTVSCCSIILILDLWTEPFPTKSDTLSGSATPLKLEQSQFF